MDAREKVVNFIPEYAAYLMNRLEVGKDGKAAYDGAKGKKPIVLGVEFGENFCARLSQQTRWKINARWGEHGILVGVGGGVGSCGLLSRTDF